MRWLTTKFTFDLETYLVLKKTVFSVWTSKLNTGLINQGLYGMFIAYGIWCVADILSVSPLWEQT